MDNSDAFIFRDYPYHLESPKPMERTDDWRKGYMDYTPATWITLEQSFEKYKSDDKDLNEYKAGWYSAEKDQDRTAARAW